MKFINKEYGFEGRPPYFNEFYEEKYNGQNIDSNNFPKKPIIGVGLEHNVPNGALLVGQFGTMWGIRVSYQKNNKWYESDDFVNDVGRLYTSQLDGNFAYFAHGNMTSSWVKYDEKSIVLSVSTFSNSPIRVKFYAKKPCEGIIKADDWEIKGSSSGYGVICGETVEKDGKTAFENRYDVILDGKEDYKEHFYAKTYTKPTKVFNAKTGELVLEYNFRKTSNSRVLIFAQIGNAEIFNTEKPSEEELLAGVSMAEIDFSNTNAKGSGELACCTDKVFNSTCWHKHYNPYFLDCAYFPRRDMDDYYSFDQSEMNLSAIVGAYLGDVNVAKNAIPFALHDKQFAVLSTWIVFCRNRDKNWLKAVYKKLRKIYPPNDDLVIASHKDMSEVGYKMQNSPMKKNDKQVDVYSLDMSCIKLLNMDILERMSIIADDLFSQDYAKAKKELRQKINDCFYNKTLGVYANKYVSGEFCDVISVTSLYPLFTGVIEDESVLQKMLDLLKNPKKFGGEAMLSTLMKSDINYGKKEISADKKDKKPPFVDFRGEIIPYINYLIYLGLVRYGASDVSSDLAIKSVNLYKKHCLRGKYNIYDRYSPKKGVLSNARRNDATGNLLAICGLGELIDVEYFGKDTKPAIKFSSIKKGDHEVSNVPLFGRNFTLSIIDKTTCLTVDDEDRFIAEGGRFEVRYYSELENGCEFVIKTDSNLLLNLTTPILYKSKDSKKIVFSIEKGVRKIKVDGERIIIENLNNL